MASIHKKQTKSGPRWCAMWRADGKQHKKVFKRWKAADDHLTEVCKEVKDGTFRQVKPKPMKAVFEKWLSDELEVRLAIGDEMKPSTAATYRNIVEKHFIPEFGKHRSDQLMPEHVSAWRKKMARRVAAGKLAKKTYNNFHALLKLILAWAREPAQCFLRHDPMEGVKRMKISREERQLSERDFLQPDEMAALLAASKTPEESAVVHLGLYCGLRRGEIFALRWADLERGDNGAGGQVCVRRALSAGTVGGPKTSNSARAVDAAPDVLEALERHSENALHELARQIRHTEERLHKIDEDDDQQRRLVGRLETLRRCRELMAGEEGYVFPSATSETPLDPDNWRSRTWEPLRKRAGLRTSIGLHSLRHSFASLLINNGENINYVKEQMGHARASFTLDQYGHLFKETSDRAMGRLQQTIRKAKAQRFEVMEGGSG